MAEPRIITVGTSAGGMEALKELMVQLPQDLPAAVFAVQHMAADAAGHALHKALERSSELPVARARDGQRLEAGNIYLATPDHHLLVDKNDRILVTKGARENRWRPAIDPLFRSAAVACSTRVIGAVLSGYLDDGTAGLVAIKRCGGIAIAQDPADAAYPDMPNNAIQNCDVDHVLPIAEMGALLERLVVAPLAEPVEIPQDIIVESHIAARVLSDLKSVGELGTQVPFNCPDCGGVLWQITADSRRYRCHTGHSFTAAVLLAVQNAKIEETMWVALRMFEERRNLLLKLASEAENAGRKNGRSAAERAEEAMGHIQRIRSLLLQSDQSTDGAEEGGGTKREKEGSDQVAEEEGPTAS